MTSATKESTQPAKGIERMMQLNEKFAGVGKQVGNLYLDGFEKSVHSVTSAQEKLAAKSKNETFESVVGTQAELARQLASTFTTTARDMLA